MSQGRPSGSMRERARSPFSVSPRGREAPWSPLAERSAQCRSAGTEGHQKSPNCGCSSASVRASCPRFSRDENASKDGCFLGLEHSGPDGEGPCPERRREKPETSPARNKRRYGVQAISPSPGKPEWSKHSLTHKDYNSALALHLQVLANR